MWKLTLFISLLAISTSRTNCQFGQGFNVFGSQPFLFPPNQKMNFYQPNQNLGNIQQQENIFSTQNNENLQHSQRAFPSSSTTQPDATARFQNNFHPTQTPMTFQDFGNSRIQNSRNLQHNDNSQRLANTQPQPNQNFRQENVSPSLNSENFSPPLNNENRQNNVQPQIQQFNQQSNVQPNNQNSWRSWPQNPYQQDFNRNISTLPNNQNSLSFPNTMTNPWYQPNYASNQPNYVTSSTTTALPKPSAEHRRIQIRMSINENELYSNENQPEEESGEISNSIESRISRRQRQSHKGETKITLKINFTLICSFQNVENSKKC